MSWTPQYEHGSPDLPRADAAWWSGQRSRPDGPCGQAAGESLQACREVHIEFASLVQPTQDAIGQAADVVGQGHGSAVPGTSRPRRGWPKSGPSPVRPKLITAIAARSRRHRPIAEYQGPRIGSDAEGVPGHLVDHGRSPPPNRAHPRIVSVMLDSCGPPSPWALPGGAGGQRGRSARAAGRGRRRAGRPAGCGSEPDGR